MSESTIDPRRDAGAGRDAQVSSGATTRTPWVALALVFFSNAVVMILEIAAGRLIAPALGTSLYTWTSVLGVVLAGLAVGNLVGGRLADRRPAEHLLGPLFGLAAAACVLILVVSNVLSMVVVLDNLPWIPRVLLHVVLVFFLPAAVLGSISPVASRMAIADARNPGEVLGRLYAAAAIGSIAGTFLAGYVLLASLGVRTVIWTLAGLLAFASLPWRDGWSRRGGSAATWLLLCFLGNDAGAVASTYGTLLVLREEEDPLVVYRDEGPYSIIEVRRDPVDPSLRRLVLDKLVHSQIRPSKPDEPIYDYVRTCAALLDRMTPESEYRHEGPDGSYLISPAPYRSLMLGGGGYSFAHHLAARFPNGTAEVVEIDPRVTRASVAALGLPVDPPFAIHHADGRVFLNAAARRGAAYDFVFVDVVQDFAVPPQFVTVEFFARARQVLKPGGTLLFNVIDLPSRGRLLAALYRTARTAFPEVEVYTWSRRSTMDSGTRQAFILRASAVPLAETPLPDYVAAGTARRLPASQLADLLAREDGRVLTDDFAPVEALTADVVTAAATELGVARRLNRANEWILVGEHDRAEAVCLGVLASRPDQPQALTLMGLIEMADGNPGAAEAHLRAAIASDPKNAAAHHNLGNVLAEEGRLAEARRHFAAAMNADPDFFPPAVGLAEVLVQQGRETEALLVLRRAVLVAPARVEVLFRFGELSAQHGDREVAAEAYAAVLRIDPAHLQALNNLGGLYGRIGRWDDAERFLREALRLDPQLAEARFNLALVLLGRGRRPEALTLLEELRLQRPDHPGLSEALRRAGVRRG